MRQGAAFWMRVGLAGSLLPGFISRVNAQAVSFGKQVAPILAANCNACHARANPQSGLDTTTFFTLVKGGKRGKTVIPGNAKDSLLVQYLEGTRQPKMPVGGSLKPTEIALIKRWIVEGAKGGMAPAPSPIIKRIKPIVPILPHIASLLWTKDGAILAAGTYEEVKLLNPATGRTLRVLKGAKDVVRTLAISPDSTLVAAGGGVPAVGGEVLVWNLLSGAQVRRLGGHADSIYGVAWRPDGKQLATASYDKVVKLWDSDKAQPNNELKEHSEAVFAAAYSPAGNYLATAGSDKAVRIWDPVAGKRLYTLAGHTEAVTALAFHPKKDQVVSVSADKSIRFWNLKADSGEIVRTIGGQPDVLNDIRFSPDGATLAVACGNGTVSVWNAETGAPLRTIACGGSPLSLAFSPDGSIVAVGNFDGSVKLYSVAEGKLSNTLIASPSRAATK